MRGRVILLLFLSLPFSIPAFPQCNYRLEYSVPLRASYFDAAIDGNDLWTATGYGVQVFDRTLDPPRLVAQAAIPLTTRSIDARAGVAWVGSGHWIFGMRRSGNTIVVASEADAGATVNDVVAIGNSVYAATANGLFRFDVAGDRIIAAGVRLATSSPNVLALARNGDTELFAADGDSTVERFVIGGGGNPAGTIAGLPRSTGVTVAGDRLFVSDGQQTAIHTLAGTRIATVPFGATAIASLAPNVVFAAGNDRRFRAVDLTLAEQPVELFAADIIPSGGTINRVGALIAASGRLFVAGGDAGLIAFDTSRFSAPFPLRSHPFGAKTSSVDSSAAAFVGNAAGGITELTRFTSGGFAPGRTWADGETHLVHDFANDFLLTSSGATLTYWAVRSGTPAVISRATMAGAVRAAVLRGSTAVALLEDRSIWTVDVTAQAPAPVRTHLAASSFLASSGAALGTAIGTVEGTTDVRFYAALDAEPRIASVAGAPTAFALGGTTGAVFTFRGITVVDLSGDRPADVLLPESNTALVRDLAVRGDRLLDLTAGAVRVWDLPSRRIIRSFALPAEGLSMSLHPSASVATVLTSDGVISLDFGSDARQPQEIATIGVNQYATKIATTARSLFVFKGAAVDVYDTNAGGAPRFARTIAVPGAIDIAPSETSLFVLFSNGNVASYTHGGALLGSTTIDEGPDAVPRSIFAVAGVPWVAISRGCVTTGCEEKTLVYDPLSLVPTASLAGGTRDVAVSGTSAFARVEILPNFEIRAYNIADPLHPSVAASRAVEGGAVSVATNGTEVFALGDRLFAYSPSSLSKTGEELTVAPVTQSTDLAIERSCGFVTGRSERAEVYERSGQWTERGTMTLPGVARSIATQNERVFILTDYSIEVWTRNAPQRPPRRRAAR